MKQQETPLLSPKFYSYLPTYQKIIESKLTASLDVMGPKSPLRDACEYALLSGGKRFRPAVVLMVAKALGLGLDVSQAALAIEYFHCASLVADDLPCMDDDEMRRDKPTVHKVYGEATALMVTYGLIAAGYQHLQLNAEALKNAGLITQAQSDRICVLALENATHNTGVLGATGGQFLDIYPEKISVECFEEVIYKKTVSLFEISFVFGWLYGGGEIVKLEAVKKLSYHFGMAFQVVDDIEDMAQDLKNERAVNMAAVMGKDAAAEYVQSQVKSYQRLLSELKINSEELESLAELILVRLAKLF